MCIRKLKDFTGCPETPQNTPPAVILSRLIYGAQVALFVAVTAAAAAGLLGTVLGLLAGYIGGWVDTLISRLVDIWMAFPAVLLSIVLVAVMGRACIPSSSPLP